VSHYASLDELERLGIRAAALRSFTDAEKLSAIEAASDEADRYMGSAVGVPLQDPVPLAVRLHVARMAVYHLLSVRGIDPDADRIVIDNYRRAIEFFTQVAKGVVSLGPSVTPPEDDPADDLRGPLFISDFDRGWNRGGGV